MDPSHAPEEREDERRVGPLVLLLPLLSLVLGLLWARRWHELPSGERALPPVRVAADVVGGWAGGADVPGGGKVSARLAPLHPDPTRQQFDARALSRRLDLTPHGQPWALTLTYLRTRTVPGRDTGVAGASVGGPPSLDLSGVVVECDGGARLLPLVGALSPPASEDVADPLQVLMAPPARSLHPGEEVRLVLWGDAPGPVASVEGLLETGNAIELGVRSFDPTELRGALARFDRSAGDDVGEELNR